MTTETPYIEPPYKQVGTRPVRHDGLEKVTGRARFAADLNVPGMLYGHMVRSPHAHARIVSIDATEALAMDGVYAVVTGDDFPDLSEPDENGKVDQDLLFQSQKIMARGKVLFIGHAVAAVAARTREIAKAAN